MDLEARIRRRRGRCAHLGRTGDPEDLVPVSDDIGCPQRAPEHDSEDPAPDASNLRDRYVRRSEPLPGPRRKGAGRDGVIAREFTSCRTTRGRDGWLLKSGIGASAHRQQDQGHRLGPAGPHLARLRPANHADQRLPNTAVVLSRLAERIAHPNERAAPGSRGDDLTQRGFVALRAGLTLPVDRIATYDAAIALDCVSESPSRTSSPSTSAAATISRRPRSGPKPVGTRRRVRSPCPPWHRATVLWTARAPRPHAPDQEASRSIPLARQSRWYQRAP